MDGEHESGGRKWNKDTRAALRDFLAAEAAELAQRSDDEWDCSSERWDQVRLAKLYPELAPPPPQPAADAAPAAAVAGDAPAA